MKRCSAEEKAMWVKDWKRSGKKAWAYAKENGLNGQTFKKWTQEGEDTSGFVEMRPILPGAVWHDREILIEKGEMKIHLPAGISGDELRTVIELLGREA
jgi:hypothetical protein